MCEKYRYEEQHCRRVAALARQLFDLLAPVHGMGDDAARLLRHAALLHDIGHFISYRGHHKHSEYLIRTDATLAGYPDAERELVAWLARSHRRRVIPPPAGRGRPALQLAALLRLADGMDHDRPATLELMDAEVSQSKLRLTVQGLDQEALQDVLRDKARLMRPAFGRKVLWQSSGP
ncbi:MAG TPA: HD domain-containing protein [Symbiobacteriaceae bacterium]|nr:HD domain-containing protein [Symbiobacteriaceae bacterium]